MKRIIVYVVCEGTSEEVYLQQMNRYFSDNDIPLVFSVFNANGGNYETIKKKYRGVDNKNRKPTVPIVIWVDKDIYRRNPREHADYLAKKDKDKVPDFHFTYMNFEDFLTLHDNEKLNRWTNICRGKRHFLRPMVGDGHLRAYTDNNVFHDYKKGELPFDLDEVKIRTLFENNRMNKDNNQAIHCEFITWLDDFAVKKGLSLYSPVEAES